MERWNVINCSKKQVAIVVAKTFMFTLCAAGFIANSYIIFENFVEDKTIVSQNVQENEKLFFPCIIICGQYKEPVNEYGDFDVGIYANNTASLDDILIHVIYFGDNFSKSSRITVGDLITSKDLWKISIINSQWQGRCYSLQYLTKVRVASEYSKKSDYIYK